MTAHIAAKHAELRLHGTVRVQPRHLARIELSEDLGGEDGQDLVLEGHREVEMACNGTRQQRKA
eukprot:47396-Eustigmatos_ZCMA.PRE.1